MMRVHIAYLVLVSVQLYGILADTNCTLFKTCDHCIQYVRLYFWNIDFHGGSAFWEAADFWMVRTRA